MELETEVVIVKEPLVSLKVIRHQLTACVPIQCRSFLTHGLRGLNGHREILFTFKLTDKQVTEIATKKDGETFDPTKDFPSAMMSLLEGIMNYAAKGTLANGGDTTRLDPVNGPGLFGNDAFRGVLYIPCGIDGFPTDALQALALTREEVAAVQQVGPVRVMAALGHANRFFPSTLWIDVERSSLVKGTEWIDTSIIKKFGLQPGITSRPSAFIYFQRSLGEDGTTTSVDSEQTGLTDYHWHTSGSERALLIYNEVLRDAVNEAKDDILKNEVGKFSLFTFPTNEAKYIITHPIDPASRKHSEVSAIMHMDAANNQNKTISMLCNYFSFMEIDDPSQWGARRVEDGYFIFVKSLESVFTAIVNGENLTIESSSNLYPAQLIYNEGHDGFTKKEEGGAEVHKVGNNDADAIKMSIHFLQPDDEVKLVLPGESSITDLTQFVVVLSDAIRAMQMFTAPVEPEEATDTLFTKEDIRKAFSPDAIISMLVELFPGKVPTLGMKIDDSIKPSEERIELHSRICSALFSNKTGPNSLSDAISKASQIAPKARGSFKLMINHTVDAQILYPN
eukprot:TRINITY_DN8634_c2_g2_i1.p1 TRINITY_DN8634_c2_g2~~TRINITY_DN8634_c2_g2_i1.p1  ORF type:complete len:579 (+),score=126.48 TRINITY_DN8634_c2_g2_i1:43-1737(+)